MESHRFPKCLGRSSPALDIAIRKLVTLGHRRIVMLTRREHQHPTPALFEQIFLDEFEAQGIRTGRYHLPDWDENPAGLRAGLDTLFQHTPPTALIALESEIFLATERYLRARHLRTQPGLPAMRRL